jgi:hypothetical protein
MHRNSGTWDMLICVFQQDLRNWNRRDSLYSQLDMTQPMWNTVMLALWGLWACYAPLITSWPLRTICTTTEWAWMYMADLPKWDSTLLEAASEWDQHSPHHPDCPPRRSHLFHTIASRIQLFPTSQTLSTMCRTYGERPSIYAPPMCDGN